jgi:hypothetical protein
MIRRAAGPQLLEHAGPDSRRRVSVKPETVIVAGLGAAALLALAGVILYSSSGDESGEAQPDTGPSSGDEDSSTIEGGGVQGSFAGASAPMPGSTTTAGSATASSGGIFAAPPIAPPGSPSGGLPGFPTAPIAVP